MIKLLFRRSSTPSCAKSFLHFTLRDRPINHVSQACRNISLSDYPAQILACRDSRCLYDKDVCKERLRMLCRNTAAVNLRERQSFRFFFLLSGCAFLTYYSRDSAISAQNALHEKRTLPGVSVYNVYCKRFTYFSTNYTPLMPPHSVLCPPHHGNLISVSLNKRLSR